MLALVLAPDAKGQCIRDQFTPGRTYKTTGDPTLDRKFNEEGTLLHRAFGVAPNMIIYDDRRSPNALASPVVTNPGYTGTVYFGIRFISEELGSLRKGEIAVAGVMAHEFAHILQITKRCTLYGKERELHADYLAGWYMRKKGYVSHSQVSGFATSLFEQGDYNWWDPSHHGTPEERVASMKSGFRNLGTSVSSVYNQGEEYVESLSDEETGEDEEGGVTPRETKGDQERRERIRDLEDAIEFIVDRIESKNEHIATGKERIAEWKRAWNYPPHVREQKVAELKSVVRELQREVNDLNRKKKIREEIGRLRGE